ncbi:MAG: NAD(P)H-dependent oxidoreductase [Robiginitalea sp.]|nr:NAD(P)H-dependent oxidoreductase [Robiginitalea sp.]
MRTETLTTALAKEYIESLNWRYATKKFDPSRTIPEADLRKLLEAVRLSASSYGLQPYKILVVEDKDLREQLRPSCWNQPQITEASHVLVIASRADFDAELIDSYLEEVSQTRGMPVKDLSGYGDFMKSKLLDLPATTKAEWTARQAYIALGNLLSAAAVQRIDACPMEGFEKAQVDEILGLGEQGLTTAVIIPIGYRAEADDTQHYKKVRRSEESLFEYR